MKKCLKCNEPLPVLEIGKSGETEIVHTIICGKCGCKYKIGWSEQMIKNGERFYILRP